MEKSDKQVNEVIKLLLSTENNISNRINDVVLDLLRLGYGDNSERGKRGKGRRGTGKKTGGRVR